MCRRFLLVCIWLERRGESVEICEQGGVEEVDAVGEEDVEGDEGCVKYCPVNMISEE
jgi:hypothetical protein